MWSPIHTAPKGCYILIREDDMLPDMVQWLDEVPERTINGTKYLARPAGWFTRSGVRSTIITPTHWARIPPK